MADNSAIEWTDATWNPVTGCTKISAGCDHCYAERFSERFRGVKDHPFERGFDLTLRPERLRQPLTWRRPRMIFVNSMSDLFHKGVPPRAQHLRDTAAQVRFLSLEPLIGPIELLDLAGIHWTIVGGESGPGARPIHPDWVRQIRNRCVAYGVPFFFKQWGGHTPKARSRSIDGREWNQLPEMPTAGKAERSLRVAAL